MAGGITQIFQDRSVPNFLGTLRFQKVQKSLVSSSLSVPAYFSWATPPNGCNTWV
jgi:hypothetical protein